MHANARLTVRGRKTLIERIQRGRPVAHVVDEMGVSRATAYKWWERFRREVGRVWPAVGADRGTARTRRGVVSGSDVAG